MTLLTSIHPISGAPLVASTTHRARTRALSLARAIDSQFDPCAASGVPGLNGYYVLPGARAAITATNSPRPFWFSECSQDACASSFDVVLLRFNPVQGVSLDILPPDGSGPLSRYLAWNLYDQGLWFIPTGSAAPFIRATSRGLIREAKPPFGSNAERDAGIITTVVGQRPTSRTRVPAPTRSPRAKASFSFWVARSSKTTSIPRFQVIAATVRA